MFFEEAFGYYSEVSPGVYLSGAQEVNEDKLREYDITSVVNVAKEVEYDLPSDMRYMHLNLIDQKSEILMPYFQVVADFIQSAVEKNKKVLIHCQYGMSRSPALLAAWIMFNQHLQRQQVDAELAMAQIRKARSLISSQPEFLAQLKLYAVKLNKRLHLAEEVESPKAGLKI